MRLPALFAAVLAFIGCNTNSSPAASPAMTTPPPAARQVVAEKLPEPGLVLPVAKADAVKPISQGWVYSKDERDIHPSLSPVHKGIDFPLNWGDKVYASGAGWAKASYQTYAIENAKGEKIGYGLGLFIQIWHEKAGYFTVYGHLSGLNDALIPYVQPQLDKDGDWSPAKVVNVPLEEFKKGAREVKQGDLIGYCGYSGLNAGYLERASNPPTINPATQKTWDPHGSHLHWEVYTRNDKFVKDKRYDPFGFYAEREAYADAYKKASGMILANPDGSPRFAR